MRRKPIEELGSWEGMTFVFHEPFTMPDGRKVSKIDCSQAVFPGEDGITPADVIQALTDPEAVFPVEDAFAPMRLPEGGVRGEG